MFMFSWCGYNLHVYNFCVIFACRHFGYSVSSFSIDFDLCWIQTVALRELCARTFNYC
jgi:hypothetical protein